MKSWKNRNKRKDRWREIINGFVFISALMLLPSLTHALSLKDALDEAAIYLTKTAVKIDSSKKMVIHVVNYHSEKQDTDAKKIETELYFALERHFLNYELVLLSEAIAGVSGRNAVFVKGTYEKQGEKTVLRLQALKGSLTGIILAQTMVGFETKKSVRKTLVAVMDIEASDLKPNRRKAYSEIFRSALIQIGAFDLASSSDIDKLNPDAIQKATGCTRDECATIIGEQLGVDRSISTTLLKLGERNYFLSSKILDIKDGSILSAITFEHKGGLDTIRDSLEKLAGKLACSLEKTCGQTDKLEGKPDEVESVEEQYQAAEPIKTYEEPSFGIKEYIAERTKSNLEWHITALSTFILSGSLAIYYANSYNDLADENDSIIEKTNTATSQDELTTYESDFTSNQKKMEDHKTNINVFNALTVLSAVWEGYLFFFSGEDTINSEEQSIRFFIQPDIRSAYSAFTLEYKW
jgi:hypothetical protein